MRHFAWMKHHFIYRGADAFLFGLHHDLLRALLVKQREDAKSEVDRLLFEAKENAVALAIALNYYRTHATVDVDQGDELKG